MTDRLFELAALDAVGALAPAEQLELHALIDAAAESVRHEAAQLYDLAAGLPTGLAVHGPSPAVRARILAHARRNS
jgi:hypothetical protein